MSLESFYVLTAEQSGEGRQYPAISTLLYWSVIRNSSLLSFFASWIVSSCRMCMHDELPSPIPSPLSALTFIVCWREEDSLNTSAGHSGRKLQVPSLSQFSPTGPITLVGLQLQNSRISPSFQWRWFRVVAPVCNEVISSMIQRMRSRTRRWIKRKRVFRVLAISCLFLDIQTCINCHTKVN